MNKEWERLSLSATPLWEAETSLADASCILNPKIISSAFSLLFCLVSGSLASLSVLLLKKSSHPGMPQHVGCGVQMHYLGVKSVCLSVHLSP